MQSYTGIHNGACRHLEKLVGRKLLYLACRHHVHELIAGTVFEELFGQTTAPQPALLTRFQNSWFAIDQSAYQKLTDKRLNTDFGKRLVAENVEFLNAILKSGKSFLRDDYKECAELSLLILGGIPSTGFGFKACGANHHARWMSKVIYSFKMYLFRFVCIIFVIPAHFIFFYSW
jgi:hypothetical protein